MTVNEIWEGEGTTRSTVIPPILAEAFYDLLCEASNMGGKDLSDLIARNASWAAREAVKVRPFVPLTDIREQVEAVLLPLLGEWVKRYLDNFPRETARTLCEELSVRALAALQGANLVLPDGKVESPDRQELLRVVQYAQSKTDKRDGIMGGGYYAAYVSDSEIVDAILASGWKPTTDTDTP